MIINTKFYLKERVWFLYNGEIILSCIEEIRAYIKEDTNTIIYGFSLSEAGIPTIWISEDDLFSNKQDLLNTF